jgi:cell division protein FtsQ
MRVSAPADKRFRRAQVKPAGRSRVFAPQAARVAAQLIVLGLLGYAGVRAAALVNHAPWLEITDIEVRGSERMSVGEVLSTLEGLRGRNIVTADLEFWRRRLLASPWVEQAALRRVLPSTIEVALRERTPMGLGRIGSQLYLVDAHGGIIDDYGPRYASFDLPIIDGLAADGPADSVTAEARAALAAQVLQSIAGRREIFDLVSQIDVRDPHDAVVILDGDPALLHLGDELFVERLGGYLEVADAIRQRVPDVEYVDLRFEDRLYVRPAGGRTVSLRQVQSATGTSGR